MKRWKCENALISLLHNKVIYENPVFAIFWNSGYLLHEKISEAKQKLRFSWNNKKDSTKQVQFIL